MASSLTILVLSLHWVYSQAETPDPTYEPTTEPTFEPTFEPTIEPISSGYTFNLIIRLYILISIYFRH